MLSQISRGAGRILYTLNNFDMVKAAVHSVTILTGACGLGTHYYSWQHNCYCRSNWLLAHSIFMTIIFTGTYSWQIYQEYAAGQFNLTDVTKVYSYMHIATCMICYLRGLWLDEQMVGFMNKIQVMEMIEFFQMSRQHVQRPLLMLTLRALIAPIIVSAVLLVHQTRTDPTRPLYWNAFVLLPMIMSQLMPNSVFGVFILWKLLVGALNIELRAMCDESNRMQTRRQMRLFTPFQRMQRFCDFADRLEVLAARYQITCNNSVEYLQMLSIPFVLALLTNLVGITLGFYRQYLAVADMIIDRAPFDIFNAIATAVFLFISVMDIVNMANLANENLLLMRETCLILLKTNMEHADQRFRAALMNFAIIAGTQKYRIKPLNLFEVDASLLVLVLGAVANFLLVLIQADLTLRLK